MNENEDLGKNIAQLLNLLRRMMTQEGGGAQPLGSKGQIPPEIQQLLKDNKNIQVNLCVFTFLPFSLDELDDVDDDYEESYEGDAESVDMLSMDITDNDKDFLKQNGLQF